VSEKAHGLGKPYGHRTDGEIRGDSSHPCR
jgi:hypothetical protein